MAEAFHGLRSNTLCMHGDSQKAVHFISTQQGVGKSYIAGTTAVSLDYMGTKAVIVALVIRKRGLNTVYNQSRRMEAISNSLGDREHTSLYDMIQHLDASHNHDTLLGDPSPRNHTELKARTELVDAIVK